VSEVKRPDLSQAIAQQAATKRQNEQEKKDLPTAAEYLLRTPLYQGLKLKPEVHSDLVYELKIGDLDIDCYCVWCEKQTPFKRSPLQHTNYEWAREMSDGSFLTHMRCQRDKEHEYDFWLEIRSGVLRKVGQTPSLEDIAYSDVARYRKVLGEQSYRELHRAGGLAAAGIGIGSFVYLRRIFERMIEEHHKQHSTTGQAVEGFDGMRIEEKIQALRDVLPPLLVRNRKAYGILSKGIHELDEDFCREHFQIVRMAIVRMAEQDFERREAAKADADMERELERVAAAAKAAGGEK